MKIKAIHHVAILTDDYEKSKKFYTEVLGFAVLAETYREERNSYKLDLAVNGCYRLNYFHFLNLKSVSHFLKQKA